MNTVRTVSDTKRTFYTLHTRPVNSVYRRIVEELMVEMHLLSVNADFRYDAIYALGVVTTFDRFMEGYRPEADKTSIFTAICKALETDPQQYLNDAAQIKSIAAGSSIPDLLEQVKQLSSGGGAGVLEYLQPIAQNSKFKYSRLFAIGLFALVESIDAAWVKDEVRLNDAIQTFAQGLNISREKIDKDLELYRSNLDKMGQARQMMADILQADRKKKEERLKAKEEATSSNSETATPPNE